MGQYAIKMPDIGEGIKWNAPSFHTSEHFATFQLRARGGAQLILHRGAKVRDATAPTVSIADPEELLEWLSPDRASVTFRDMADVDARRAAFTSIIQQWLRYV